jgi:hypothetical protein
MGSLSDAFSSLSDVMQADVKALGLGAKSPKPRRAAESEILVNRLLKTFVPKTVQFGGGNLVDVLDRQVGPFDLVAHADTFPALGDPAASLFLSDGVIYTLAVSDQWTDKDLSAYADMASQAKTLQRKGTTPLFNGVVDFGRLDYAQASAFLRLPIARPIDFFFSLGQYCVIRNLHGWYGNAQEIEFVTERGGPESLKAFALLQLQVVHQYLNLPFTYGDYQHL